MEWLPLTSQAQLAEIIKENSNSDEAIAIFKHSTRCSISTMAMGRLERKWASNQPMKVYYLDLLRFRDVSDKVADLLAVHHESPQIILLKGGKVIYHQSHQAIMPEELANYA